MSSEHGQTDPMLSPAPWAKALGLPGDGVARVVIDVRAGALPVVMVEAQPGSDAARALCELTGRLDAGAVVQPMGEEERATLAEVLEDLRSDAESLAMRGDKGRAEFAGHYAGRLARAMAGAS